jgi:hypothetical protein
MKKELKVVLVDLNIRSDDLFVIELAFDATSTECSYVQCQKITAHRTALEGSNLTNLIVS